jgi:ATP/maltotriose-dependent transcriptional regulator MalT
LSGFGWLAVRLGRLSEAKAALTRAIEMYDQYDLPPPEYRSGHPKMALIFVSLALGDYGDAARLGEEMRHMAAQANQPTALSLAYYASASAALAQGYYEQARHYGEEALALRIALGVQYHAVSIHDLLGQVAISQGELVIAKRHFEAAYALSATLEAQGGMALHLKNLGDVAARQQRWQEAHAFYEQSRTRFQTVEDRGGIANAERGLAITAYHLGDLISARRHFRFALDVAVATQSVRILLPVLASAGIFMIQHAGSGRGYALGQQILRFVTHHPTCDRVTYEEASEFLRQRGIAQDDAPGITVEALVAALQAELVTAAEISAPLPPTESFHVGLVEPLTDREIAVVRLLATGYSNAEIASELVIAVGTVKAHTSNIYRKLDVTTRAQAVSRLHTLGLLE